MRLVVRLVLTAIAFAFLLPLIPGIDFHGNFGAALVLAVLFSIMSWIVDLAAMLLSAVLTVSTLGVALLWLIPLWILGFWLLPAVTLLLVSDFMPSYVSVSGWMPAVFGGLVMLLIGAVTSSVPRQT
jgi:uncharacterized membrane protein YvlD (DUF360 family)